MMKLLLLGLVIGVVVWMIATRRRGPPPAAKPAPKAPPAAEPAAMLACAHCSVHLPASESIKDLDGRPYCGEPHRLAGPR